MPDTRPRRLGASVDLFTTVLSTISGVLAVRGLNCQIDVEAMNLLTQALGSMEQAATPLEVNATASALQAYRQDLDRQIATVAVAETVPALARRSLREPVVERPPVTGRTP